MIAVDSTFDTVQSKLPRPRVPTLEKNIALIQKADIPRRELKCHPDEASIHNVCLRAFGITD
jgi:hypothetical protein